MITQQMSSGSFQVLDIRRSLYLHRLFSPGGVGILSLFIAATGPMALALAFARRLRHGALSALMKPSYLYVLRSFPVQSSQAHIQLTAQDFLVTRAHQLPECKTTSRIISISHYAC